MKFTQLSPVFLAFAGLALACSDSDEGAERNDDSESSAGGSGGSGGEEGSGGSLSDLYDLDDGVEVCTSMKSERRCEAVEFDYSGCADCSGHCGWGTVSELHERYGENVFGEDGFVAPFGGLGGFGGSWDTSPGCYLLAGDGG